MWRWRVACVVLAALCVATYVAGRKMGRITTEQRQERVSRETQVRVIEKVAEVRTRVVERDGKVRLVVRTAVEEIAAAPGADDPIPPDVRRAWVAGLERVRDAGAGDDPGSAGNP